MKAEDSTRETHGRPAEEAARARVACQAFAIDGRLVELEAFERGHIHDTWIGTYEDDNGAQRRFLHQHLNRQVFGDIDGLMCNIERITQHLAAMRSESSMLQTLELVRTRDGASYLNDAFGQTWRTYVFIENTQSHDRCAGPEQAHEAARVFAEFQRALSELDTDGICETIPRFFSSPYRLQQLGAAVREDLAKRVTHCRAELDFVDQRCELVTRMEDALRSGTLRRRVIHGDTKLNNILFDRDNGRPVAVVDLDTCMPGYAFYDFGDLVRFTAARSAEDEVDLAEVGTDREIFRAIVDGWLAGSEALTHYERTLLPVSARLVTLTVGIRFLADYIAGDVYFKTARPEHNLDRARVQFAMVADMEAQDADFLRICGAS